MAIEVLFISDEFKADLERVGFSAAGVFARGDIVAWRTLADRENCKWKIHVDGREILLHVKRFGDSSAVEEAEGYRLLESNGIATAVVVAWGCLADGRSFLITKDLAGYYPADKIIDSADSFQRLLIPTANLVARLHDAGLHHRDLYLCHFFVKVEGQAINLRLIDAARVRPMPRFLRRRWVIKDLAQFWYSTLNLPITGEQRKEWLGHYASERKIYRFEGLLKSIERKSGWIAGHDRNLRRKEPGRNISIPE